MAFHQPTRQFQQRIVRVESNELESQALAPQIRSGPDESQTWVLFSPATDAGTTTSYLSSVQEDQPTPGRSRISDLGSLDTIARSDIISQPRESAEASDLIDESLGEDDAELDSLDSHLPEFRTTPSPYNQSGPSHAAPVFPNHDGLGSFRLDGQGMSTEAQDRLYAFERYNPRRVKRRRESLDLVQLELENEAHQELERNRRIEAWRLEHSQFLLQEIQRETRRRRQSEASASQRTQSMKAVSEDDATMNNVGDNARDVRFTANDWHDQDAPGHVQEGLWSRITRTFIRDLMGIDDRMLSILIGESLPEDDELSSTPKASALNASAPGSLHKEFESSLHDSSWQLHMLERIARELGLFVHQMSTHHPGAFSTYQRMQQAPIPYAGLPVIPEAAVDAAVDLSEKRHEAAGTEPSMPQFQPTVTRPVDIPGARPLETPSAAVHPVSGDMTPSPTPAPQTFTQQEWEQDLDIKLVFRYLRSRFTSSRGPANSFTSGTSHLATSSTQDAAAKAARVRQHHPLVSHAHVHQRSRPAERRTFKATTPSSPVALRHPSGSCASQSTRRSARRSSVSSRHSSRHYWDIGGSIGTGSMIASAGPMGSWGEV